MEIKKKKSMSWGTSMGFGVQVVEKCLTYRNFSLQPLSSMIMGIIFHLLNKHLQHFVLFTARLVVKGP